VSVSDDGESTGGGGTLQVLISVQLWCNSVYIEVYFHRKLAECSKCTRYYNTFCTGDK
jgi:hypothetical protein